MRLKILTDPPLPTIKAWFTFSALKTITDLKKDLCTRIQQLKEANVQPQNISLLLDDFELLNDSTIDVVRDGDLILIQTVVGKSNAKRKSESEEIYPSKKRKRTLSTPQEIKTKRSLSSSCSSTSDSDSSSDASSSSSSSSTSLSGSSSSPAPQTSNKPRPLAAPPPKPTKQINSHPPIPPGYGKPTTHSRNLRRRLKRQHERAATQPTSLPQRSLANAIPLGAKLTDLAVNQNGGHPKEDLPLPLGLDDRDANASMGDILSTSGQTQFPKEILMGSLRNKNKKKGFKQSMNSPIPKKIVFSHTAPSDVPSTRDEIRTPTARLITPAEKQDEDDLPSNIFVTSVDVEEGVWPRNRKARKDTEVQARYEETTEVGGNAVNEDWRGKFVESGRSVTESTSANKQAQMAERPMQGDVDYRKVEQKWETYAEVKGFGSLNAGAYVCWKALGINPATFTPEVLVNVAQVIHIDPTIVEVRLLQRPGAEAISFGQVDEDDEEEIREGNEEYTWDEVAQGNWRIIPWHT